MGGAYVMKRIPLIKFPPRHAKPSSSSSSGPAVESTSTGKAPKISISRSDVPAPPANTAMGGKASLQPKRTPVSENEIEAVLLGGCI